MEFILNDISTRYGNCNFEIITPKETIARGCQLSVLMHGQGKSMFDFLTQEGVIADWREPNVIRMAPVPLYNTFNDVYQLGQIIEKSIEKMSKKITIAGAGLVGSLEAIYMAKRGHKISVYERRSDMRQAELVAGRSINLALSTRGWTALKKVGIDDEVRKMAIPMPKRIMHAQDGTLSEQPYGQDGEAIYSVSRGGLNVLLMNLAEREQNIDFHFNHKLLSTDLKTAQAVFEDKNGKEKIINSDVLIGADGTYSTVRNHMMRQDRFQFSQYYIDHGYKELTIPANPDGSHQIETNALHIWPRGNYMLIALPNMDGSYTCTLFFSL